MEIEELRKSLAKKTPPRGISRLLQALWYDARGEWQHAHEIAQSVKGKAGARVHAYLHRKEGDLANANYWHKRAGTKMPEIALEQEWENLAKALLREERPS